MDLNIRKDLASNWFKLLQDAFCNDINVLENNKTKFKTTTWKKNPNKDEGGGVYKILKGGKRLKRTMKLFQDTVPRVKYSHKNRIHKNDKSRRRNKRKHKSRRL